MNNKNTTQKNHKPNPTHKCLIHERPNQFRSVSQQTSNRVASDSVSRVKLRTAHA
jgi:hypothetical protein